MNRSLSSLLALCISICISAAIGASARAQGAPASASDAGASDASADAGPAIKVVRVRDLLKRAVQHYQRGEFDEARRQLDEILGYVGKEKTRAAQQAHLYRAFVHVAFNETEQALAAFERALEIDPTLRLEAPAPKIAAAFAQALTRYRAKVRALDHDPPALVHAPPAAAVKYRSSITIAVEARDASGVKAVTLHYRVAGGRGFSSIALERGARGRYVATIPSLAVARPGLQYYVEAYDVLGNGPGLKGSQGKPIFIEVTGGPKVARAVEAGPRPWYKKWWVWAIAAGTVAAAGGIGAAVYATRDETASYNVRLPGGLDPGGGK